MDDFRRWRWLALRGVAIPAVALSRDPAQATIADPLVQDALLQVYRERPLEAQLCERLVDLDEGLEEGLTVGNQVRELEQAEERHRNAGGRGHQPAGDRPVGLPDCV